MVPAMQGEIERGFADNSVKLIGLPLVHQFGKCRARIKAKRFGEIDELDDINPAFTDFDAGDDGLRGFEPDGDLMLRQLQVLPGGLQGSAQGAMPASAKGLQCACSQLQAHTYNAKINLCDF